MDEGWAKSTRDPYTPNPKVDLHELIRYGKEKKMCIRDRVCIYCIGILSGMSGQQ